MYKRGVRAPHMNQGRVWCFTARVLTALNCAMVDHGMIIDRGMKCHFLHSNNSSCSVLRFFGVVLIEFTK